MPFVKRAMQKKKKIKWSHGNLRTQISPGLACCWNWNCFAGHEPVRSQSNMCNSSKINTCVLSWGEMRQLTSSAIGNLKELLTAFDGQSHKNLILYWFSAERFWEVRVQNGTPVSIYGRNIFPVSCTPESRYVQNIYMYIYHIKDLQVRQNTIQALIWEVQG